MCPVNTDTDQTLVLQVSPRRPGCARTLLCAPTLQITLCTCSVAFSSAGHFLGHVLEIRFGRRPQPSGSTLSRSSFMMELLLWRPALSQKCPLPVPACSHRTAMQQECDQAARALRPYTKLKGSERECGSEKRTSLEDKVLMAGLPCWDSLPIHICTQELSLQVHKISEERSQKKKKSLQAVYYIKTHIMTSHYTQSISQKRKADNELERG